MLNTKFGLSSGRYRIRTVVTLTDKNGNTETVTVYSEKDGGIAYPGKILRRLYL